MNGTGPTSVTGQAGEYKRVVDWINNSYMDIQLKHDDWNFMWAEFSKDLTAGTGEYTAKEMTHNNLASQVDVARFDLESFRYYLKSSGVSAENFCCHHEYHAFRDMYRFGSTRTQQGVPSEFAVAPNKNVLFWQTPNDVYVINGIFYRAATKMSADSDVPILPSEFHYLIVWWALTKYAGFEESSPVFQNGVAQLNRMLNKMERQERPEILCAEPLA